MLGAFFLFLGTFFGGALFLWWPQYFAWIRKEGSAFGGSYLFTLTVFHLIPHLFEEGNPHHMGGYLLLGFYIQLLLDFIGHGIAHGHDHKGSSMQRYSLFSLLFSLLFHAFLEGMLLGLPMEGSALIWWGLMLHKLPAAFSLTLTLSRKKIPQKSIFSYLCIFSLASPLAALVTAYGWHSGIATLLRYKACLSGVATGSLLHIASTILFESEHENHNISLKKWFFILLGLLLALLSSLSCCR